MSADYHVHTAFSGDSDTPMEAMAETALKLKLSSLCFTEHMDLDFPGGDTLPFTWTRKPTTKNIFPAGMFCRAD